MSKSTEKGAAKKVAPVPTEIVEHGKRAAALLRSQLSKAATSEEAGTWFDSFAAQLTEELRGLDTFFEKKRTAVREREKKQAAERKAIEQREQLRRRAEEEAAKADLVRAEGRLSDLLKAGDADIATREAAVRDVEEARARAGGAS